MEFVFASALDYSNALDYFANDTSYHFFSDDEEQTLDFSHESYSDDEEKELRRTVKKFNGKELD